MRTTLYWIWRDLHDPIVWWGRRHRDGLALTAAITAGLASLVAYFVWLHPVISAQLRAQGDPGGMMFICAMVGFIAVCIGWLVYEWLRW